MKFKYKANILEVSMSKTERAIISELVAFGLDSDIEALTMGLDDYNINTDKVKKIGEEFVLMIRHNKKP